MHAALFNKHRLSSPLPPPSSFSVCNYPSCVKFKMAGPPVLYTSVETMGKMWVAELDEERPIIRSKDENDWASVEPLTMSEVFQNTVNRIGYRPALAWQERGIKGPWTKWTWAEYFNNCRAFAKSLVSLGVEPHKCINIIGFNCKEWFVANNGAMLAGVVPAGIYTTTIPSACHYISSHSEGEVVVCDGRAQLQKYLRPNMSDDTLPCLKALVMFNETLVEEDDKANSSVPIYTFAEFMELGKDISGATIDDRMKAQKPGQAANLIYTSGTTGPPKAVMISHDNIYFCYYAIMKRLHVFSENDRSVSYLPLSHIAALLLDILGPIYIGCEVYFARPDVMRGTLVETLNLVQPTWFFGVPRVYEKIYEKMMSVGKDTTGIKKTIATWAKGKGAQYTENMQFGGSGKAPAMHWLAKKLVFNAIRQKLGLNQTWGCFTAAAPISDTILKYFGSIGIPIYEVFGQSECTGPHSVNFHGMWKIGTTGRPLSGTQSKIDPETGELCYRGRHIFLGYLKDPKATAETIDDEGWLHSGDVAAFDEDEDPTMSHPAGFLKITGRIKELIITAGGENIAPNLIEDTMKKEMPCINNCIVIGDQRKYLVLLIALTNEVSLNPEEEHTGPVKLIGDALETSIEIGSTAKTVEEAEACEKWKAYIDKGIETANESVVSRAATIKKWALIPQDFSERGGELGPTMKLKRRVAIENYDDIISRLYAE